ncbi:helix-turn-helix domain-containing protein [Haemophilus influenzae]
MNNLSAQLENQIDELKKLQKSVITYEQAQRQQLYAGKITDLKAFGKMLNDKRKSLGIELSMLELQTGVSISTLNRLFQDPSQVRFTTVFLVAQTLGGSLCAI